MHQNIYQTTKDEKNKNIELKKFQKLNMIKNALEKLKFMGIKY